MFVNRVGCLQVSLLPMKRGSKYLALPRENGSHRTEVDGEPFSRGKIKARVKSAHLFKRDMQWAEDNHIIRKMSGTSFGLETKRTFQRQRNIQGTFYRGIGLLSKSHTQALQPPEEQESQRDTQRRVQGV